MWWRAVIAAAGIAAVSVVPSSRAGVQSGGGYAVGWHATVAGGVLRARNSCYRLSGSTAQATVTPGITMGSTYTLYSGFWAAAPIAGQDEIFFNGFEDCKS
ncbi:MAG: hypothetical protein ACREPN_05200 [Rudaea sp.]